MAKNLEEYLQKALDRLEQATNSVRKTQGFSRDTAKMRLLTELVREQLPNENTRHSTRQTR